MAPGAGVRTSDPGHLLTAAATAWLLIVVDGVGMGGSAGHHEAAGGGPLGVASLAAGWLLMLTAMMAPLLTVAVRHLQARSLARRRARVVTLFLAGYAGVWLAAGGVLTGVAQALLRTGGGPALAAALAITLAWHATPARARCLNRTHAHPALPAFGPAGDAAALRFGCTHAAWCVGTCGAAMLLPLVVAPAAEPVVMAAVALWLAAERLERPAPPRWGPRVPSAAAREALRTVRTARHVERNLR